MAKVIIDVIPGLIALYNESTEIFIEDIANNSDREIWFAIEK